MVNRGNYELYFLLYIDNELSAPERQAVEQFVQQHSDLAGELELLAGATLFSEPALSFPDKDSLYRQAITDEALLLYIDQELPTTEQAELKAHLQEDTALQQRLEQFEQTKLPAEPVVFEEKEILYRSERRRVVPLAWSRLAVAVAVAGIAVAGLWLFTNDPSGQETAESEAVVSRVLPATGPNALHPNSVTPQAAASSPATTAEAAATTATTRGSMAQASLAAATANSVALPKEAVLTPVQTAISLRPVEDKIATVTPDGLAAVAISPPLPAVKTVATAIAAAPATQQVVASKDIVYKELDTSDEEESLNVGSLELNKNRVTGLFKRASRLLGGKAKNPDNL